MRFNGRKTKKCPRCGNKCLISQAKCDDCGLLFARLDDATNKAGRIRLARKQKEYVINVTKCPKDIKKWKLILMVTLLGLCGGHYFYVGKWKNGLAMLLYFFSVVFIGVIFNAFFLEALNGYFFSIYGVVTGVYCLVWLNDIRRVVFNTFKIPVSILSDKENEEYLAEKEQEKELKKEIKALVKERKKEGLADNNLAENDKGEADLEAKKASGEDSEKKEEPEAEIKSDEKSLKESSKNIGEGLAEEAENKGEEKVESEAQKEKNSESSTIESLAKGVEPEIVGETKESEEHTQNIRQGQEVKDENSSRN